MICLHILQLLEDEGFGTIDSKTNGLFYGKLPLGSTGVGIYERGSLLSRGTRMVQEFDLYSRGSSDLLGADKLEKIQEFINQTFIVCDLPLTPKSSKQYTKVTLEVTSSVENLGLDENDRLIFRLGVEAKYNKGE